MKCLTCILLLVLSEMTFSHETPEELRLHGPSVVALYTPDWEVTEEDKSAEGFYDFLDDFQYYSGELQNSFSKNKNVEYFASCARKVSFTLDNFAPVTRKSISGYGFIVYVPGKAPKVIVGVATDVDVLCTLKELDVSIEVSMQCDPNKVIINLNSG